MQLTAGGVPSCFDAFRISVGLTGDDNSSITYDIIVVKSDGITPLLCCVGRQRRNHLSFLDSKEIVTWAFSPVK